MASMTQRAGGLAGQAGRGATRNTQQAGPRRSPTWLAAVITAAVVATSCAACSSPGSGPGSTGSGPAAGPAAKALAYTQCMRSHGIKDYPDPGASGDISVGSSAQAGSGGNGNSDMSPNSPAYQAANQACRSLLGGSVSGRQPTQNVAAGVKLAACMRSHSFPSFPDPTSQNVFNIPAGIDMNSAAYQSAFSTCQSKYRVSGARYSQRLGNGPGA
jgi:hypothetical protein